MANQEQQRESQGNMMMRRGVNPTGLLLAPGDLFRMSPFSLMRRMSEEMDRVFGEFGLNRGNEGSAVFAPPIEVSQTDGAYQVRAELPGVKPSDVEARSNRRCRDSGGGPQRRKSRRKRTVSRYRSESTDTSIALFRCRKEQMSIKPRRISTTAYSR